MAAHVWYFSTFIIIQLLKYITLGCLFLPNSGIFGATTYLGYSGGCQLITLSRLYRCPGLPKFFHILKLLGQEQRIILQCAQCISGPDSVIARDWRFGTNGIDKRERDGRSLRGIMRMRHDNSSGGVGGNAVKRTDEPPTRPGRPIRRCRDTTDRPLGHDRSRPTDRRPIAGCQSDLQ